MSSGGVKRAGTLTNLVHRADLFNGPIYLNIKGRQTMATTLGGLLSIVLVLLLLAQAIVLLVQMFDYQNPNIVQITEFQDPPGLVPLNYNNDSAFSFGFSTTVNGLTIDMTEKSLFLVTATFNVYNWTDNNPALNRAKYTSKINFAPCDRSTSFTNLSPEIFNQNGINAAFCPISIIDNTTRDPYPPEFAIAGSYLDPNFQFIQFNVKICNETGETSGALTCDNMTNVTNIFATEQVKFNLYFTNNLVAPGQYSPATQPFLDSIYWDMDPTFYKVTDIYIDQGTVQNYDSIWSSTNNTNQTFYSFNPSNNREQMMSSANQGGNLLQWNIRRSNFNYVTTRRYTKIQDILANIGGLSKSIMFAFAFIAAGYVRYKYQTMLSNELYNYEIPQDGNDPRQPDGEAIDLEGVSPKKRSSVSMQQNIKVNDQLGGSSQESYGQEEQQVRGYFMKEKKSQVRLRHSEFGYFGYILSNICCCCSKMKNKPEERIARKARTYVEHDIDIVEIIQKLKDVEKLKLILLTQDQRELFNNISKPVVKEDAVAPEARDVSIPFEYNFPEAEEFAQDGTANAQDHAMVIKYMKLYYSYKHISTDPQLSQSIANKRLLALLGEDVLKIFNRINKEVGENPDSKTLYSALWKYIESEKKNQ